MFVGDVKARDKDRESEISGIAWENNGNGHGSNCSCWRCEGYHKKRIGDIYRKYDR